MLSTLSLYLEEHNLLLVLKLGVESRIINNRIVVVEESCS